MGEHSSIEWTTHTFNPWIGCTRISCACDNCYAADLSHRFGWARFEAGAPRKRTGPGYWSRPLLWNRKAEAKGIRERVFPSLCDPFDAEVDPAWRDDLFRLIASTPSLDWLLLTKRPPVAANYFNGAKVPANVWLGTTAENRKMASLRLPQILSIDASRHFVSIEPAVEGYDLTDLDYGGWRFDALRGICHHATTTHFKGLDWVIVGGESGRKARPLHPAWVRSFRDQCLAAGVAFFFKQWGEWGEGFDDVAQARLSGNITYFIDLGRTYRRIGKDAAGATLDGREWRQFPA